MSRSTPARYVARAIKHIRAREGWLPCPANWAHEGSDFDEARDLPDCLQGSPAKPVSPPAVQSASIRGAPARKIESAMIGDVPTPIAQPPTRSLTDEAIADAYPTMGYTSSPERDFMTALRDGWRDQCSVTPPGCVQEYRAPLPEDFLPPAEALRMRDIGDPLKALVKHRPQWIVSMRDSNISKMAVLSSERAHANTP